MVSTANSVGSATRRRFRMKPIIQTFRELPTPIEDVLPTLT